MLIWALFITVTLKYVFFLMRADNKGEGGTLSLMALARNTLGQRNKTIFLLGVAGAALFSGDAVITPAISVLSAVEGLKRRLAGIPALCAADLRGHPGLAVHRAERRHGAGRGLFRPDHGGVLRPARRPRRWSNRGRPAHPRALSTRDRA